MTGHNPPAKTPVTITLDNSTHISGDNNKVCLPGISASASAESTKLATMLALALRHVQGADGRTVNINVKGGLSIYGNRNVVVTNGMVPGIGRPVAVKTEVRESLKRKAEEVRFSYMTCRRKCLADLSCQGPDEEPPTKRVEAV